MTITNKLHRVTWIALAALIVAAGAYSGNAGADYTARLGDDKNYGGKRDFYAERILPRSGIWEFTFQVNVIDADSLSTNVTKQLRCYLDVDGEKRVLLGYATMARSDESSPDQQGVGLISGTVRLKAGEYAILYCDTDTEYGVTVLTTRLYKRLIRGL